MKRIIIIAVVMICALACTFADKVYEIETKYGTRTVVVPEGYTEEDVMLILAKNYYELDYEYKELSESAKKLVSDVESYMEENKKLREDYDNLISDYDILVEKLDILSKKDKISCFTMANALIDKDFKFFGMSMDLGICVYEAFLLKVNLNYGFNDSIGFGVGFGYLF